MEDITAHIGRLLKKERYQRIGYLFFILLWILAWYADGDVPQKKIDWILITPIILLAGQAFLNSKFLWIVFCSFGILAVVWFAAISTKGLIIYWTNENFILTVVFNAFSWAFLLALFKMKPGSQRKISFNA